MTLEEALHAIARVRYLHSARESLVHSDGTCRECQVAYPCDTIIALDEQ